MSLPVLRSVHRFALSLVLPRMLSLVLPFVLLISQQMAYAHGWTHWDAARQALAAQQAGDRHAAADKSDPASLVEFCLECAADAQLDLALPLPDYGLRVQEPASGPVLDRRAASILPRPHHAYQPRGPPHTT